MIDEHKWPPWQNKWRTDFRMRPMKEEDKPLPSRIQARQFIFFLSFFYLRTYRPYIDQTYRTRPKRSASDDHRDNKWFH